MKKQPIEFREKFVCCDEDDGCDTCSEEEWNEQENE